jgi:protoporphyrin/coproporphyrin ferrochelatase
MKKAVLLINLGTPDNPGRKAVGQYLKEFLNDPMVIDLPAIARWLLVNGIIIPFRVSKSSALYRRVWTDKGSPLLYHMNELRDKLQIQAGNDYDVFMAMRYRTPSIGDVLMEINRRGYDHLQVWPFYPQYASSTTGSVIRKVEQLLHGMHNIAKVDIIRQFYSLNAFIDPSVLRIADYHPEQFDHLLFSFHSVPLNQINNLHAEINSTKCHCQFEMPAHGTECYKAGCYDTARLIAQKMGLAPDRYSVAFQSRFARRWLGPFVSDKLMELRNRGVKRLLVAAPSFTTDCLETIVEIGQDYRKQFLELGGEELTLVECLNASDAWVSSLHNEITGRF